MRPHFVYISGVIHLSNPIKTLQNIHLSLKLCYNWSQLENTSDQLILKFILLSNIQIETQFKHQDIHNDLDFLILNRLHHVIYTFPIFTVQKLTIFKPFSDLTLVYMGWNDDS